MNFRDMAEQNESWIIEQRRYFHAHPELLREEIPPMKSETVWRRWDLFLTITRITTVSGQWSKVENLPRTVRPLHCADIDALPVEEHTGLSSAARILASCMPVDTIAILQCSLAAIRLLMAQKEQLKGNKDYFPSCWRILPWCSIM